MTATPNPPTSSNAPVDLRKTSEDVAAAQAELEQLYPRRWRGLWIPLCSPTAEHMHGERPCKAPGKVPEKTGWQVRGAKRWNAGSLQPNTLDLLLRRASLHLSKGSNIGLVVPPGMLAIDCDDAKSSAFVDGAVPDAPMQATAAGAHFLVRLPEGLDIAARAKVELTAGVEVDLRVGGRSQIVVEPSIHATGVPYTWKRHLPEDPEDVPMCPQFILDAICAPQKAPNRSASKGKSGSGKQVISEGGRNSHLASLAGSMRRRNMTTDAIAAALDVENEAVCRPPLDPDEVRGIAASIGRYTPAPEKPPPHAAKDAPAAVTPSDKPNSRNLVEEEDRPPEPIHAATVEEILADQLPDTRCDRIVWEGNTTLLLGLAKQGKTYLAAQLALCLASGEPFLELEVQRSRVLYTSWEITLAGLLSRMRNIARDCGLPDPEPLLRDGWLHFYAHRRDASVPRLDLEQERDWTRLRQLVGETDTQVLIVDTLRKALPHVELKDDQGWSAALQKVTAFARETGVAPVLVDHGHRGRTGDTAAAFAMGSQVKGSEIPCLVKLERTRKEAEPDRWSVEVDSWFDDPGTPIWYVRPERSDGERGCGCDPCEAPAEPTRKGSTTVEMENWLRDQLGDKSVGSSSIYAEAEKEWPSLDRDTRERKLRRALVAIGGSREEVKGSKIRQTLWSLD